MYHGNVGKLCVCVYRFSTITLM